MASSTKAQAVATYVGQKVSAVRWRPTFKSIEESTGFVSGGWDDEVSFSRFSLSLCNHFLAQQSLLLDDRTRRGTISSRLRDVNRADRVETGRIGACSGWRQCDRYPGEREAVSIKKELVSNDSYSFSIRTGFLLPCRPARFNCGANATPWE